MLVQEWKVRQDRETNEEMYHQGTHYSVSGLSCLPLSLSLSPSVENSGTNNQELPNLRGEGTGVCTHQFPSISG